MRTIISIFLSLLLSSCSSFYVSAQYSKTVPIAQLVSRAGPFLVGGYVSLFLNKVEVSPTNIRLHFFVQDSRPVPFVSATCGLKGAYVDDYKPVIVRGITLGRNFSFFGSEKSFIIEVTRPAKGLYLTGINLCGVYKNGMIQLSKGIFRKADVNISWAIETVPFKKEPAYIKPVALKDTKGPTIALSSQETSQGIYRTEDFSVIISGKAKDEAGIAFVTVNEQSASLRSDGRFQKRIKLKIGKNPVIVSAIDINDNKTELKLTIIREEFIEDEEFSDVDFAPETGNKNRNGIAVVFGIEDYQYAPSVSYAYNDADIFREYLIKTFGYSRENIYFRTNERATKGEFDKAFSENGWIAKNATRKSDVIIFYAGHGAPDLKEGQSYLVPYDIDPNYATTGYALDELYQNLGKLKVNSITVILDACFSGGTRDNQPLLADARPVYISVEGSAVPKNTVVFSAASGREISSAYKQKLHGLFTYFFLKGLNGNADGNKDKKITVMEMQGYLEAYVPQQARKMGREQTPTLIGKDSKRILLRY